MMAALCMTPLMAENLRDIADNLPVAPRVSGHKLEIPSVPGAQVRFLGADYEQIIRSGGNIVTPLTDTQVKVSFVFNRFRRGNAFNGLRGRKIFRLGLR